MMRYALSISLIWIAPVLSAFDAKEHASVSENALTAAMRVVPPSAEMENAVSKLQASPWTFSDVVVGVDWFQGPGKLIDPQEKDKKLRRRRWNYVMRGMAAHHNYKHFQRDALEAWRTHHEDALQKAKNDPEGALLSEAVALHYLQDFFSVGHLVTPRNGMHDAAAGDMHDHFNKQGIDFHVAQSDEMAKMIAALAHTGAEGDAYRAAAGQTACFHGDGRLNENPVQRLFVEAISAFSIAEVFNKTRDVPVALPVLEGCARPRSAPREEILDGMPKTITGPDGGIRLGAARGGTTRGCDDGTWLGRYEAQDHPELNEEFYELTGFILRSEFSRPDRSSSFRKVAELRVFGLAEDPVGAMVDSETGDVVRQRIPFTQMQLGSAGLSYIWGENYSAWGFLWDIASATPVRGLSWSSRFGPRFYKYDDNNAVPRIDLGLKVSYGLEIVGVTVGIERSYEVDRNGSFGSAYFTTFGLEFSGTEYWTRYAGFAGHLIRFLVPPLRDSRQNESSWTSACEAK